jgi:hypothetical protein
VHGKGGEFKGKANTQHTAPNKYIRPKRKEKVRIYQTRAANHGLATPTVLDWDGSRGIEPRKTAPAEIKFFFDFVMLC